MTFIGESGGRPNAMSHPSMRMLREALRLVKAARIEEAEAHYDQLLSRYPGLPSFLGWPSFSLALEEAGYEEQARAALERWEALRRMGRSGLQ